MESHSWSPIAKVYDPLMAGSIDGTDKEPHDQGIIRAMNAKYRPNKAVVGDPECTLFVARLHPKTSEDTLREVFSSFGEIKRIRLVRDIVTGFSKCYGFVEFLDDRSAHRAQKEANKLEVDTMEIFVDFECERLMKGWVPRRLGGGWGGKKESGQLRFGGLDRPFRKPIVLGGHVNKFLNRSSDPDRRWGERDKHRGQDRQFRDESGTREWDQGVRNTHRDSRHNKDRNSRSSSTLRQRSRSRSRERSLQSRLQVR